MAREMVGKKFGRLCVLSRGRSDSKHLWWKCRCSCPKKTVTETRGDHLRLGTIRSCGCLQRQITSARGHHYERGRRFGRLTVVKELAGGHRRYFCKCRCGNYVTVRGRNLASGETKSCGCWYRDSRKMANFRHGMSPSTYKTPEYSAYHREKSLCRNPLIKHFKYYGGRGIEFRFDSFPEFYAVVGNKPPGCWLMRIDRDGHFESGNLEWVPRNRK
jgi:hypothetical protein